MKNHVHNILEKLQVNRRGEAAARVRDGSVARALADRAPSPVGGFRGRVVVRTRPGDAALLRRDRRGAFQRSPQS